MALVVMKKITVIDADGFADFDFPLTSAAQVDDGALTVFWGNGAIIRSGAESDDFCGLLQDKYQVTGSSREMIDLVETMVVSIGTDPARITEEPLKMKMFVEPEGDDSKYAEFFLNVDLRGQVVQFHEKDNGYRENLVRAFCR